MPRPIAAQGRALATTAAVALLARLAVAVVAWDRFPPADDGVFYDRLARRLAHGLGYTWAWPDGAVTAVAHYPVGYPALLALAYRAMGERPAAALLLHALIGALGAVAIHVVAATTSARAGRWAGLATALHPALLSYTPALMTEGVCSALLALPFAAALVARPPPARALIAGALLGGVALVRPQALLLVPVVAGLACMPWDARPPVRRASVALALALALVVAGAALVVAPWALRNRRAFGHTMLVSANGGWNLWIGTDAEGNGGWRPLESPPECREVWDEAEKDSCFGRAAARRIAEHPLAWLALAPSKLAMTFDLGGSGPSYLSRSRPDLVSRSSVLVVGGVETLLERGALIAALLLLGLEPGEGRRGRLLVAAVSALSALTRHAWLAYVGLTIVLALGLRQGGPSRPLRLATCGVLSATIVTHAIFFGAGRYGLLVYPWVAAVACAASATLRHDARG